MFRRIIFENWAILCTLIAFVTALSIFLFIAYRALRMSRKDASRIAQIPLEDEKGVPADEAHKHKKTKPDDAH